MLNYLFGGRFGDLIHGLVIPRYLYDTTGEKANIYIANIGAEFTAGIETTYNELKPIMLQQDFVASFEIYATQKIDYHMYEFRNYPKLYTSCWTDVYFDRFLPGERPAKNYKWLKYDSAQNNSTIVSRAYLNSKTTDAYKYIIKQAKKTFFISPDEKRWKDSELSDCTELLLVNTIEDIFSAINSCRIFLGDQSAHAAIAWALGKPRIVELNRLKSFYEYESKYYDDFEWFHNGYLDIR